MKVFLLTVAALFIVSSAQAQSLAVSEVQQGQQQGQGQDQLQAQDQTANSIVSDSGNSAVVFDNSFNGSAPVRYLPMPTAVNANTAGGPDVFSQPEMDKGANFTSMRALVQVLNSAQMMNSAETPKGIKFKIQKLNADMPSLNENQPIDFSIISQANTYGESFQPLAIMTLRSEKDLTSVELAIAIAAKAREVGASRVVFVKEGVERTLSSWGLGIGLSYNYASVGSNLSDHGSAGAGGTGWSMGEGRYISKPYLTAVLGN